MSIRSGSFDGSGGCVCGSGGYVSCSDFGALVVGLYRFFI